MDATDFRALLREGLQKNSGLAERQDYLGMSGIGRCPLKLYRDFVDGRQLTERNHWCCWTGCLHEAGVLALLGLARREREIVAEFDVRFRGHTDYWTEDGTVVDIKSVTFEKLQALLWRNELPAAHVAQMQMYMRHGGFDRAVLVYVARDVPHRDWRLPFTAVDVKRDVDLMDELDEKARRILLVIDRGEPPTCECGYCR